MKRIRVDVNIHNYYFDIDVPYWNYDTDRNMIIKKEFYRIIKENPEKLSIIDIDWDEVEK